MCKCLRIATIVGGFLLFGIVGLTMGPEARGSGANAYEFAFESIDGERMPLAQFAGKPVLVVNTASMCGFTPQYEGLQVLWQRYRDRGLVLVGVPSNDFGGQEPGSESEIKEFCEVNFNVDFPMTTKQHVVGPEAHPLFSWFVEEQGQAVTPRWNFHKFLIASDGSLANTWPSRVTPLSEELTGAVEAALAR